MKLQQLIAALLAFIVVLLGSIYPLHLVADSLFPGANTWITYGLPELIGLGLAVAAAYFGWKMAGRQGSADE